MKPNQTPAANVEHKESIEQFKIQDVHSYSVSTSFGSIYIFYIHGFLGVLIHIPEQNDRSFSEVQKVCMQKLTAPPSYRLFSV